MKEVHLICNAHIDPIWQWDWQEGAGCVLSTFRSAVNLAKDFDYVFCHNEATIYKYVEEYDPALFEEIRDLVKAGKWHIMGGWYLQPDCNMPSGESLVRQILEGKRYFESRFGTFPTTAINFDSFGHSRGLVQIIAKCGQDSYVCCRPDPNACPPDQRQFIWEGFDGSRIKVMRAYDGGYSSPMGRSLESILAKANSQPEDTVCVLWGVGNHGGGPSRKDLADIRDYMQKGEGVHLIHSTPEQFFANIDPESTLAQSLRISMPGCYTSMGKIKRKHVMLENELYMAEKMLSAACISGALADYPEQKLHEITEDLLNAEFHDVLPGSCIQSGEDNGLKLLDHGLLEAERLKTRAFFAMALDQDVAAEGEYPVLVYNPTAQHIRENVEFELMLADQNWTDSVTEITVKDADGNVIPAQRVKEESNLNLDWRKRVTFMADVPPMSMRRYGAYARVTERQEKPKSDNLIFDNGRKRVVIDRKTGLLSSFSLDGTEYVKDGFGLCRFDDNPDPWAMQPFQLSRLGTGERAFTLMQKPDGVFAGLSPISVIEDGDIYMGVEALFSCDNTRARVLYKIYKNNDLVDVDVTLFLGDVDCFVKLKVPFSAKGQLIGQTVFGTEELYTDARENVSQRFIALDDGQKCTAVLNNCLYGSHFESGALYLSLVRGVSYCAHPIGDREIIPTDRFIKKIDQGESNYSFRLGVFARDELENAAQRFNHKPYVLNTFPTGSAHPATKPFSIDLGDHAISLVTLKRADDTKDTYILRLFNNTPNTKETVLTLCGATIPLTYVPYEVKTVLYKDGELRQSPQLFI
ncbi:MAG: alpha-mannosidase [Clostridia bacterium]|nr:alpha-mannosidase [Clostridia bacterium]